VESGAGTRRADSSHCPVREAERQRIARAWGPRSVPVPPPL